MFNKKKLPKNRISVDVGIPIHNGQAFIERSVNSVLSQRSLISNLILIDDGSFDESLSIAIDLATKQNFFNVLQRVHNAPMGIAKTYNEIGNISVSDYVLILDQDDYLLPKFFDNLKLDKWSPSLIRIGNWTSNSKAVKFVSWPTKFIPFSIPVPKWLPILGIFTTRSSVLYPRNFLQEFPFQKEDFEGNDILQLHQIRQKTKTRFFPKSIVHYEIHETSVTSNRKSSIPPVAINKIYELESMLRRSLRNKVR